MYHAIALIDFKGELPDKSIKDIYSSMYLRDGYWGNDYGFSSGLVIRNQGLVGVVISNNGRFGYVRLGSSLRIFSWAEKRLRTVTKGTKGMISGTSKPSKNAIKSLCL